MCYSPRAGCSNFFSVYVVCKNKKTHERTLWGNVHIPSSCLTSLRRAPMAKGCRRSKKKQVLFGSRDLYQAFPAKQNLFGVSLHFPQFKNLQDMRSLLFHAIVLLHMCSASSAHHHVHPHGAGDWCSHLGFPLQSGCLPLRWNSSLHVPCDGPLPSLKPDLEVMFASGRLLWGGCSFWPWLYSYRRWSTGVCTSVFVLTWRCWRFAFGDAAVAGGQGSSSAPLWSQTNACRPPCSSTPTLLHPPAPQRRNSTPPTIYTELENVWAERKPYCDRQAARLTQSL